MSHKKTKKAGHKKAQKAQILYYASCLLCALCAFLWLITYEHLCG